LELILIGFTVDILIRLNLRIGIPSLHVYGLEDKVIGDMSRELVPYFEAPTIVEHPGGHFIPATSRQKEAYLGFLNSFKQKDI
jgi:hypothetical protein